MCLREGIELLLQSKRTPDYRGWGDTIRVVENGHDVFACPARGAPNWRAPLLKGGGPWYNHYGWLAEGQYSWQWRWSWRHAAHLSLNNCGDVASRRPNPRHGGAMVMRYVLIHAAQSAAWPGSAGCITIPPMYWPGFMAWFKKGNSGWLEVKNYPLAA